MTETEARAALLRAGIGLPAPSQPTDGDWPRWINTARVEGVVPLAFETVSLNNVDLNDESQGALRQLQGAEMLRVVELEHYAITVSEGLSSLGIRHAILKGSASAHLDYPVPEMRSYADVDVLIAPEDRGRSAQLLADLGFHRGYELNRRHEEFTHAVTFVQGTVEIDLHQRIARRSLGLLVPVDELLENCITFGVAGRQLPALADEYRLVHAAMHSATSGIPERRRLSSLADVLVMADRRPELAASVTAKTDQWRLRSLLEREVEIAYDSAQVQVPQEWLAARNTRRGSMSILVDAAYLPGYRRPVLEEVAYLRFMKGLRSRLRYLAGHIAGPGNAASASIAGSRQRLARLWRQSRSRTWSPRGRTYTPGDISHDADEKS